jgi:hypothetical protein
MFGIRASTVIESLADQLIPRNEDWMAESMRKFTQEQVFKGYSYQSGVVVPLACTLSAPRGVSDIGDISVTKQMFVVVCGRRHVWVAQPEKRYLSFKSVPMESWKNTSNHDSCWRTDGIDTPITAMYFTAAEEVNKRLPKEIAPGKMKSDCHFGLSGDWGIVKVTHCRDENDDARYRRKLLSIELIRPT